MYVVEKTSARVGTLRRWVPRRNIRWMEEVEVNVAIAANGMDPDSNTF